jgi:nucleoside-diphosphate-sugar epimerase
MIQVTITGGTGFVGYWMRIQQPNDVSVRYLNSREYHAEWELWGCDVVYHLANVSPSRVLKYAKRTNAKVIFASSGAVYNGVTDYSFDKRLWEAEVDYSGLRFSIARLFTFIGRNLENKYAITNFVEDALKGHPIKVQGNGTAIRSYLDGRDLGRQMWELMDKQGTFDVGSIKPYSIMEVANEVAKILPSKIIVQNKQDVPNSVYLPHKGSLAGEQTIEFQRALIDYIEARKNESK